MVGGCWFLIRSRFGNLFSVEIDDEPVGDANLVRRAIIKRDTCQERRLKPAAMLIRGFEIHVGRIAQFRMQCTDGFMRNAAVDPDINRIVAFRRARRQSKFFCKIGIAQFKPNVRAALSNEISELADDFCIENCFVFLGIKNGKRHAPASLSGNHPIGTRFDRACDAVLTPRRNPFHFAANRFKRSGTQIIDTNKELLDIAKDDRRFRTPAVRIGVMKILRA